MSIELGSEVRDMVTGFYGIAVARIDHLFAASEIKVQPKRLTDEGRPMEPVWFEEARIEVLTEEKTYG